MLEALELARASGHKGFESEAADELASVYLARLELDRAEPLIEQAILLAEESGSAEARGRALRFAGQLSSAPARARRRRGRARGGPRAPRRGRCRVVARPHAQLRRLDGAAQGRARQGGAALPRVDPDPRAARGPRDALRDPALAGRAAAGARAGSTRPSGSRWPRVRPSARTTSARSPPRRCRSAWCAPRRAATRRPRSCLRQAYDTLAETELPAASSASRCRRSTSSCATAAATTRPPSSGRAPRGRPRRPASTA